MVKLYLSKRRYKSFAVRSKCSLCTLGRGRGGGCTYKYLFLPSIRERLTGRGHANSGRHVVSYSVQPRVRGARLRRAIGSLRPNATDSPCAPLPPGNLVIVITATGSLSRAIVSAVRAASSTRPNRFVLCGPPVRDVWETFDRNDSRRFADVHVVNTRYVFSGGTTNITIPRHRPEKCFVLTVRGIRFPTYSTPRSFECGEMVFFLKSVCC